jgi:endonuclease/exonuclease/phosphatase family metal-dependent hydrolase
LKGHNYTIAVTHLSPLTEDKRLEDVKHLFRALNAKDNIILIGDMNSISASDIKNGSALLKKLRKFGITKFGTNRFRTEVIQRILKSNLLDTVRFFSTVPGRSVPTKYCIKYKTDYGHSVPARLDFIFVTKNLKTDIRDAHIIRTKETAGLSDHYPVTLKLIV